MDFTGLSLAQAKRAARDHSTCWFISLFHIQQTEKVTADLRCPPEASYQSLFSLKVSFIYTILCYDFHSWTLLCSIVIKTIFFPPHETKQRNSDQGVLGILVLSCFPFNFKWIVWVLVICWKLQKAFFKRKPYLFLLNSYSFVFVSNLCCFSCYIRLYITGLFVLWSNESPQALYYLLKVCRLRDMGHWLQNIAIFPG